MKDCVHHICQQDQNTEYFITPCSVSACYSSEESGLLELDKFLQFCTENFTLIFCEWVMMKTFLHPHVPPMKLAPWIFVC